MISGEHILYMDLRTNRAHLIAGKLKRQHYIKGLKTHVDVSEMNRTSNEYVKLKSQKRSSMLFISAPWTVNGFTNSISALCKQE